MDSLFFKSSNFFKGNEMENIKYVKTFEEAFTSFFKKESTIQKINPDIYEFAIRY